MSEKIKVGDEVKLRRATITPLPAPTGIVGRIIGNMCTVRFRSFGGITDETFVLDELELAD